MNRYIINYHYQLKDLVGEGLSSNVYTFEELCDNFGIDKDLTFLFDFEQPTQTYSPKLYIADMWERIKSRYEDHYCFGSDRIIDFAHLTDADKKDIRQFVRKLINVFMNTYDRYSHILTIYKDKSDNLMDKVKQTTKNVARFNDTPQNAEVGDEFEGDDHVTTINKNIGELESDTNTIMARIKEIEASYNNVILNWLKEFDALFLEEDNL